MDGWIISHKDIEDEMLYGYSPMCQKRQADYLLPLPSYLTSYDAIIPLIQKQDDDTRYKMWRILMVEYTEEFCFIAATPSQLADALLTAKGFEA